MKIKNRISIVILGCPKNEVDAEVLASELKKNGFNIIDNTDSADIVVIFTCGFIKDASQESIDTILEYSLKNRVIVTGCLVSRYGKKTLAKLIPEVIAFFGTYEYLQIISYLKSEPVNKIDKFLYSSENRTVFLNKNYSYIKISEGCNNRCSFCTIPLIKGNLFSRKLNDIIDEAKKTIDNGIDELILISQNSGDYGKDLKNNTSLTKLLNELLKLNGLRWLRLLYLYPDNITEEVLEFTKHDKFCNYLDIPVQHIDNDILQLMNRKITEKKLREMLENIKINYPDIYLRTSLIVGFPGETERQFNKLLDFVKEYEFYNLGCFVYSNEEGSKAYSLPNHLSKDTKFLRYNKIMKEQNKIINKLNEKLIGKTLSVNVSGYSEETDLLLQGRTEFQTPDIDGLTFINKGLIDSLGFYKIKITNYADYDLIGEIVN